MSYVLALSYFDDDDFLQTAWVSNASPFTSKQVQMGTNCAPLLADVFLYSYGGRLLKKNEKELPRSLNFTFRYIDVMILARFVFSSVVEGFMLYLYIICIYLLIIQCGFHIKWCSYSVTETRRVSLVEQELLTPSV